MHTLLSLVCLLTFCCFRFPFVNFSQTRSYFPFPSLLLLVSFKEHSSYLLKKEKKETSGKFQANPPLKETQNRTLRFKYCLPYCTTVVWLKIMLSCNNPNHLLGKRKMESKIIHKFLKTGSWQLALHSVFEGCSYH